MSESRSTTDLQIELLQRIGAGDSAALGTFYDLHAPQLLALACRILNDQKEAEDVLQEVFLQLWEKAASFDPNQGRPLGWVLTLTRNRAIDKLRAAQRRRAQVVSAADAEQLPEPASVASSPPDEVHLGEQGHLIRAALANLPAPQRRAIELAFFDGLSQTEIATALGEPLGTVKARIRRGMLRLRDALEQHL